MPFTGKHQPVPVMGICGEVYISRPGVLLRNTVICHEHGKEARCPRLRKEP